MSTIPKNPNISLEFSPDNHTLIKTEIVGDGDGDGEPDDHTLVKTEIDGDGDGDGEPGEASGFATSKWLRHQVASPVASIEKIFSDHHRSRGTTRIFKLGLRFRA